MIFLTQADFKIKLPQYIQEQITDNDSEILDDAEAQAMAVIQDNLSDLYDLDTEFAKTDTERHKNLLRWLLNLSMYFIHVPYHQSFSQYEAVLHRQAHVHK